jgi:hypothetical protein
MTINKEVHRISIHYKNENCRSGKFLRAENILNFSLADRKIFFGQTLY